jgi:penicillin-binding protein 2
LEEGVINPQTTFTCNGILWLPNHYMPEDSTQAQPFYCWQRAGHGQVNLDRGLALSCDIYFYQVGGGFPDRFEGLGLQRLGDYAHLFGFGQPTGIGLSGEASGLVPTERWKRETWDMNWVTGDTYNVSIGQGYILSTPLQLLNATAAVANGGILYRPRVVHQILNADDEVKEIAQPEVIRELPISSANMERVRQGMRDTVTWGTANRLDLGGMEAGGKTGTAEFPGERDEEGHLPTHAWFGGFAPYENPEIAVVVFIADGGQGALEAVPVAAEIMRHHFQIPEPTPIPAP